MYHTPEAMLVEFRDGKNFLVVVPVQKGQPVDN